MRILHTDHNHGRRSTNMYHSSTYCCCCLPSQSFTYQSINSRYVALSQLQSASINEEREERLDPSPTISRYLWGNGRQCPIWYLFMSMPIYSGAHHCEEAASYTTRVHGNAISFSPSRRAFVFHGRINIRITSSTSIHSSRPGWKKSGCWRHFNMHCGSHSPPPPQEKKKMRRFSTKKKTIELYISMKSIYFYYY